MGRQISPIRLLRKWFRPRRSVDLMVTISNDVAMEESEAFMRGYDAGWNDCKNGHQRLLNPLNGEERRRRF